MRIRPRPATAFMFVMCLPFLSQGFVSHSSQSGTLRGHVLDCNDGVIAGAKVKVTGPALQKPLTALTDARGRYLITGLPAGSYDLEAAATGFSVWKRGGIEVASGSELSFEITLQRDTADEAPAVKDLPTWWRSADAVVYLRIEESLGVRPLRASGQCVAVCTLHRVSVLEVFRRYRGEPREKSLTFLQGSAGTWPSQGGTIVGRETPGKPGDEMVAFLIWNNPEHAFQSAVLVPVLDGQVRSPHIEELQNTMRLEAFLAKLRAMME